MDSSKGRGVGGEGKENLIIHIVIILHIDERELTLVKPQDSLFKEPK